MQNLDTQAAQFMPPAMGFDALMRPLTADEHSALWGAPKGEPHDLIAGLNRIIQHGSAADKAAATKLAGMVIYNLMAAELLDPEHGALPEFVRQVEAEAASFDRYL